MVTPRLRYTHYITIYSNTHSVYSGVVAASMTPSSTQPSSSFKLELTTTDATDITGIKITGSYDGSTIIENITLTGNETIYSENIFDSVTSLVSKSFDAGTNIQINAVDDAYQPIFWETSSDPYKCTFSTVDGMAAGIQPENIGLRTVLNHYVRLPLKAPVSKNMEFSIVPMGLRSGMYNPYDGKRYVAITDFDVVCIPPRYMPIEWAFRATQKNADNND